MANNREDHLEQQESKAKQHLEQAQKRWPTNSKTFLNILLVVVVILLVISLL
ncbi:MAG: hypothetical protein V3V97_04530 [Hyphomicrobiaceae bacterium]